MTEGRNRKLKFLFLIAAVVVVVIGVFAVNNLSADSKDKSTESTAAAEEEGSGDAAAADSEGNDDQSAEGEEGDQGDAEEEKAPIPVEVAAVESGTISSYIRSTANLVADNQVRVLSEVEGKVATLEIEEGDYVKKGQPLAKLVQDEARISLKKAELKEANARMAFERVEDLVGKELISREEYDRFTMEYEIARQELAEAEWRLEKTVLRAPFSGRLSERMIQVGQHVRPGDELFQVTDLDPLISRIYLPERDVLGLDEGREVRIRLNADESVRFAGRIRQISPIVDTSTGTVKVTIEASKPPRQVRPGSFVTIDIVRETHAQVALVPREAVLRELASAHLFVAEDDHAVKREITVGFEEDGRVEAISGVEPGERVIVAGQGGLRDGSPVKVLAGSNEAQPAS